MLGAMATLDSPTTPPLRAETPTCIQPGGVGLCGRLELAWGRLRRAYLRRFRPRYVRRMGDLRQGNCAGCPHEVIDSRDLKYFRNVCHCWWRPEHDPFRQRDELPLIRYGAAEVVCLSTLFALLMGLAAGAAWYWHPAFWLPVAAVGVGWGLVLSFFRNPHRQPPADPQALLSPADGTVTHVEEVDEPDFPGGRAVRVSIFLSVFNVHVNRVPRSGRVVNVRYFRGCFLDARHPQCGQRNEQLWVDLEDDNGQPVRVKQIAGAIARRIVCRLKPGDRVEAGELYGMIKFGSRTEVLVPAGPVLQRHVQVGDKVYGATTVLLRFC